MRILWQPAETEARDFVEISSADWARIEAAPDKSPLTTPGAFVNSINVQGVVFDDADHYHVEHLASGGARVWSWWDDPTIWAPLEFRARVVTLENLRPDPLLGGAWNTAQSEVWYGQPGGSVDVRFRGLGPWQSVTFKPWSAFAADLPTGNVLHGIMLPDPLWVAAQAARTMRGWREWTEGVDPKVIDPRTGKVGQQAPLGLRSPKTGTYTRYLNDQNQGISGHTLDRELATYTDPTTAGDLSMVSAKTSAATEAWGWNFGGSLKGGGTDGVHPNGLYQAQIDCTLNEGSHVYGIKTLNSVTGHFGIWNAIGGSHTDSWEQTEGTHSGTGVKVCSRTLNPTDGDVFDLYQAICVIDKPSGHGGGDHTFTLELNEADDLIEGPWDAIIVSVDDEIGARIHGQVLGLGNDRGARIEGDAGSTNVTSEIGGRIQGVLNVAAEIGGRVQGVLNVGSEVGARVHGIANIGAEIGARLHGIANIADEVGARIEGKLSAAAEVGSRLHGQVLALGDDIGGRLDATLQAQAEIGARIEGILGAAGEIGARIQGVLNVASEIGGRIEGQAAAGTPADSEIGARLHGIAQAVDEIGARLQGVVNDQSEIGARVQGVAQDSTEVGGRVHGTDQASSVRGARIEGLDAAQDEVGARIHGVRRTGPATSFHRGARIHGEDHAAAEIGGRIEGETAAQSEVGARIEGQASTAPPAERLEFTVTAIRTQADGMVAFRRQNFEKLVTQRRLEEELKR